MNLQHVKYFISLAEERNYQKAADKNFITQPALSNAIQNLEKSCGVKLFKKEGRKNILTEEGEYFYYESKKAVLILDDCLDKMKNGYLRKEDINVGAIYSCATTCVPLSFALFKKDYSRVNFSLSQLTSDKIIEKLKLGQLDMGLVSYIPDNFNDKSYDTILLFYHHTLAALPNNSPLIDKEKIYYKDIVNEPFAYYTKSCGNHRAIELKLKENNLEKPKNITIRCDSEDTVISSVRNNLGIGLISDTAFNRTLGLNLKPIEGVSFKFPIYLIWNKERLNGEIYSDYIKYVLQSHLKSTF